MRISREQFSEWITVHHKSLYKHALWMLGDVGMASEAVQEAFYQAWKSRDTLQNAAKPLPWLLTILRRAVFREIRQRKLMDSYDEICEGFAAEGEDAANLNDEFIDLARALQRLNADQREIMVLYALHGFSYQQIAEHLDIPIGTVMSRLARARRALDRILSDSSQDNVVAFPRAQRQRERG